MSEYIKFSTEYEQYLKEIEDKIDNHSKALDFINSSGMPVEVFMSFLQSYKIDGDLNNAIDYASCEWDL